MLGSRTKQVFAYGRRGHRIVNVSDREHNSGDSTSKTNGDTYTQPRQREFGDSSQDIHGLTPQLQPSRKSALARENAVIFSPSPPRKTVFKRKKVVSSPTSILSSPPSVKNKHLARVKGRSPKRAPLTPVQSNIASPHTSTIKDSKLRAKTRPKPRSPPIHVDIIVLDSDGRRLSEEHRISKPDVQANTLAPSPRPKKTRTMVMKTKSGQVSKRPTLLKSRLKDMGTQAQPIVLSSGSELGNGSELGSSPVVRKVKVRIGGTESRPIIVSSGSEKEGDSDNEVLQKQRTPSRLKIARPRTQGKIHLPPRDIEELTSDREDTPLAKRPPPSRIKKPAFEVLISKPSFQLPKRTSTTSVHVNVQHQPFSQETPRKPSAQPLPRVPRAAAFVPYSPASPPKERPLTPIKQAYPGPVDQPTPSSPSLSELESELARFVLDEAADDETTIEDQPAYLRPLLAECGQTAPHEFSAFVETFPFDPVVASSTEDSDSETLDTREGFRKIGEASYSEVFGIGGVVLKVIPLRSLPPPARVVEEDLPPPSDAEDVLREMIVTRMMGDACPGFVRLLRTYIVRGRYPSVLLNLWDEYDKRKGSESIRPDAFPVSQTYAIIALPNGGPDLEAFAFRGVGKAMRGTGMGVTGWHQACGVFWQVATTLGKAEELVEFEHRDLHWGQILVRDVARSQMFCEVPDEGRVSMDSEMYGVQVTLIDLGLSRMNAGRGDVYFTTPEDEVFEGEGDYQYDVYRLMQKVHKKRWEGFNAMTNVMWLHYLVTKLLRSKDLKGPRGPRKTDAGDTGMWDERSCYRCLTEAEVLLRASVDSVKKAKPKTSKTSALFSNAADILKWGAEEGWIGDIQGS